MFMSILITNRHRSPVKMKMKQGIPNFEESEQKQSNTDILRNRRKTKNS